MDAAVANTIPSRFVKEGKTSTCRNRFHTQSQIENSPVPTNRSTYQTTPQAKLKEKPRLGSFATWKQLSILGGNRNLFGLVAGGFGVQEQNSVSGDCLG